MNIFVGNLSFDVTENELQAAFSPFGSVKSAKIVMDQFTNRSRGFGFIEMARDNDAQAAISALDGTQFNGRQIRVNEARGRALAAASHGMTSHTSTS